MNDASHSADESFASSQPDDGSLIQLAAQAQVSPWTLKEKMARALWIITQGSLFRWSWHSWYGWRRLLLRAFGAQVAPTCRIRPSARIEIPWNLRIGAYSSIGDFARIYNLGMITVGDRVTISQGAHLCAGTHDHTRPDMPLLRPPIDIEDDAWIAADAFVGPNVRAGRGAVLGAGACAFRDLTPWTIYGGNPARAIGSRTPWTSDRQPSTRLHGAS